MLLCHCPSLINSLDYDNCPGLRDAVFAQSKGAMQKHLAEDELVSLLKKAVKKHKESMLHGDATLDNSKVSVVPTSSLQGQPRPPHHVQQPVSLPLVG